MNINRHISFAAALSIVILSASATFAETNITHTTPYKKVNDKYQYQFPVNSASATKLNKAGESNGGFYDTWIRDRLSVGLGITAFKLTKNHRTPDINRKKNFIGAVTELHECREFLLTPSISYSWNDYFQTTLSYADITANTENFNNHLGDGHVHYRGPILALEGTYPLLDGQLITHAGAGIGFLWGDFHEDKWWNLGYASYDSWVYRGSPSWRTQLNYYREIHVDEFEMPIFFNLGATYRFTPNWGIDFTARYMMLDPDNDFGYHYTSRYERHNVGDFDLTHFAFTLSATYTF